MAAAAGNPEIDWQAEIDTLAALEPLKVILTRVDCLLLLSLLQVSLRNPAVADAGRDLGMKLADTLENAVSVSPALREVARRGWDGILS